MRPKSKIAARSCTRRESPPCYSAHAARAGRLGRAERTGRTRGDADGRSGVAALRRLEALDKAASMLPTPRVRVNARLGLGTGTLPYSARIHMTSLGGLDAAIWDTYTRIRGWRTAAVDRTMVKRLSIVQINILYCFHLIS